MKRHALAAVLALGPACATLPSTSIRPEKVVVSSAPHPGTVSVAAQGSARALGVGRALLSSDGLREAIEESLREARTFERVAQGVEACDWHLSVTVEELEPSEWSLVMYGSAKLHWHLAGADGGMIAEQRIDTRERATSDDTEEVEGRGRLALQRSLRKNLALGLAWLAELELAAAR